MSEDRWETFAQEDAEFYIYSIDDDFSSPEGRKRFFESGVADVGRIFSEIDGRIGSNGLAVEIGCGIGRLAVPMSERFERLIGVDIAPTMLKKLQLSAEEFGRSNIIPKLAEEAWEQMGPADLIYSHLVFQHIGDFEVIASYLQRSAQMLGPGGLCHLQFDTRPTNLAYSIRALLPDVFLPRTSRRGIRRVRRAPSDLRTVFSQVGLKVVDELRPGTAEHVFVLAKA